jgi:surface antigen
MAANILQQGVDAVTAAGAALTYAAGNCTRWVAEQLTWIPAGMGNAAQWLGNAQAKGLPTIGPTSAPPIGSVAVWGAGSGMPVGHVAEVVGLIPGGFQVSEENFLGLGRTDIRNVPGLGGVAGFILPPGGAVAGAAGALASAADPFGIGSAIAGVPASIGHGLANAGTATGHNLGTWAKNNIVGLVVALVVALVIFGGDESKSAG